MTSTSETPLEEVKESSSSSSPLKRESSITTLDKSCPICMELMIAADMAHPLLCRTRCGYDFCMDCMEHLIESSKSAVEMASDGNMAVKVRLQCPQCRSDISDTIHDTLLLRKNDKLKGILDQNDSDLSATELREKASLECPDFTKRLNLAKAREEHFLMFNSLRNFGKEEGMEIEKSGQVSLVQSREPTHNEDIEVLDDSLFSGLEFAMTSEEQTYVSQLMTSGNVAQLAQAAQILENIADLSKKGITPSMRGDTRTRNEAAAYKIHHQALQCGRSGATRVGRPGGNKAVGRALAMGMSERERKEYKVRQAVEEYKKTHPLPVRMPNFVILDCNPSDDTWARNYQISFLDDEWDGTVADAFARVVIGRNNRLLRKPYNHPGVQFVLNAEMKKKASNGNSNVNENGTEIIRTRNRIVVSAVRGMAGKQGIQKGDVVTHFNGELFEGTAEDLREAIQRASMTDESFTLVLNAESSTAEALRLRGIVLQKIKETVLKKC